jgi:hypothetical protein
VRRRRPQSGLTATELVVVSGLFVTLSALVYATVRYQAQATRRENAIVLTQSDLRLWLARMVRDLRTIGYDPLRATTFTVVSCGAAPSYTCPSSDLRFSIANDANRDNVIDGTRSLGYRISGNQLQQWLGGSSWRTLVSGVSGLTFTYYDGQGTATTYCPAINAVEMTLSAEATSGTGPGATAPTFSEHARVELRNGIRCS